MNFDITIIEKLKKQLHLPLPGEVAQYRMAPSYRPNLTREHILQNNPRSSGVMLLLYSKASTLYIAFTERKKYAGVHSGQMSFPGGKKEEKDIDLTDTAFRETFEEIGIAKHQIQVLGKLSELYIPPSNYLVYPTVGYLHSPSPFIPQPEEVEKLVEIPLDFFFDDSHVNLHTEIRLFDSQVVKVPAYVFGEHIIWGATAIMLSEFTFVVQQALKKEG